jgi:hypothetical protein
MGSPAKQYNKKEQMLPQLWQHITTKAMLACLPSTDFKLSAKAQFVRWVAVAKDREGTSSCESRCRSGVPSNHD